MSKEQQEHTGFMKAMVEQTDVPQSRPYKTKLYLQSNDDALSAGIQKLLAKAKVGEKLHLEVDVKVTAAGSSEDEITVYVNGTPKLQKEKRANMTVEIQKIFTEDEEEY